MLLSFENQTFVVGKFDSVIKFLLNKKAKKSSHSNIILACSLNDLALQSEIKNKSSYELVTYCTNDSMFLTHFFRHKYRKIDRVYGPDLMSAVIKMSQKTKPKLRHFFVAPSLSVMNRMISIFNKRHSEISCNFTFLPKNISNKSKQLLVKKINDAKVNCVWLGIGSPKQVEVAAFLKEKCYGIDIFCVGAAFDFFSANKKQAPLWIQKSGLEWLFRLLSEPRRLWRRYLIVIPRYLLSLLFRWRSCK